MTHTTGEFDLAASRLAYAGWGEEAAMMRELLAENDRLRALVDSLVERCARQSEALSRRAEAPVPRPLFDAAVRVLKAGGFAAGPDDTRAVAAVQRDDERLLDTAERLVRRAAACGVGEEG